MTDTIAPVAAERLGKHLDAQARFAAEQGMDPEPLRDLAAAVGKLGPNPRAAALGVVAERDGPELRLSTAQIAWLSRDFRNNPVAPDEAIDALIAVGIKGHDEAVSARARADVAAEVAQLRNDLEAARGRERAAVKELESWRKFYAPPKRRVRRKDTDKKGASA